MSSTNGTSAAGHELALVASEPWQLLNTVKALELSERPQHLQPWLDLVAKRPAAERDALLAEGREVWRYRMDTVRGHLREIEEIQTGAARTAATVATDDFLAEMVYNPTGDKQVGYLVHHFARPDNPPEWVERIELGKATYYPPGASLLESGTILLPSAAEEYYDEWNLYLELTHLIKTYFELKDEEFRTLACCYVLMTWVYDRFDALPYLRLQGDFGTGKSTLLRLLGSICYRPTLTSGATTPSPIFRLIDRYRGALIIDEADFDRSEMWAELVKILNTGYQRGYCVLRSERNTVDGFDVKAYDCYGPKLLATRRRFHDEALESRCLSYTMPLLEDLPDRIPFTLGVEFRKAAQALRNKLLLWRFRVYNEVVVDPRQRIKDAEPRVNQIVQPLLASVADEHLQRTVLGMVTAYSARVQEERRKGIVGIIAQAFLKEWVTHRKPDRILQKTVVEKLHAEYPELKKYLGHRAVGDSIRRNLGIESAERGGLTWVYLTQEKAGQLSRKYGINLTEYGGV